MQSLRLKASDAQNRQKRQRDVLGVTVLFNLIGLGLIGFLQLSTLLYVFGAANRPAPSLVQLNDGSAITTAEMGSKDRTDATIRRFTLDTMTLLMSWTGKVNVIQEGRKAVVPDTGMEVDNKGRQFKVASSTWQASFALSEDFRAEMLQKLAELTPDSVFSGQTQVVFVPREITNIKQVEEGKWRVSLVANLISFNGGTQMGQAIPFNKEVYVRAVQPPRPTSQSSDLELLVAEIRQAGLEIYAITDLKAPELR